MSGRTHARACPPAPSPAPPGTAGPRRTCVGCRECSAKIDLLRVVAVEGTCVPDRRGVMPGRGAYLHPDEACLDRAERRKAFPRALRVPGPLDLTPLRAHLGGDPPGGTGTQDPAGRPARRSSTGPAAPAGRASQQYLASRK